MTLHFQERLDLTNCQVLPISQGDKFVEGTKQFVGILQDFPLIQGLACACNDLCKKVERVDVLQDVGLLVGDKDHVQFVEGLVYETDIVLLDGSMLSSGVCQLGKRGKKSFNSRSLHLTELSG